MPAPTSHFDRAIELARHLTATAVAVDGQPVVVYRGEHGVSTDLIHARTRSVSFGSAAAASEYAQHPNQRGDVAVAPRVIAAYLAIANPVIDNRDDPFIEMGTIVEKLGRDKAERIARRFAGHIENTGNWVEGFSHDYDSVEHMLDLEPDRITDLYLDAYPVFDDDEVVGWFAQAGYDGAIHLGNGITALEPEYKVFDQAQIHCAIGIDRVALLRAMVPAITTQLRPADTDQAGDSSTHEKEEILNASTLLQFCSNYRGETEYLVLKGALAGRRVSYRYMNREFYEQDYADFGGRVWSGDSASYRREVLGSVGLVCCSGALVPPEIVDEVNRLSADWRDQHPDLCAGPARAGVYVQGRGWSEAADIVFQYGYVLERFPSVAAAEQWLSQPRRAQPDQVWEEGGGQVVREFSVSVLGNRIVLVEQDGQEVGEVEEEGVGMTVAC
ncbi:hypothetical protein ACFPOU_08065 [Massilia jejuensis]|uniref:Uncharacterized protein n=1 Tax=Massilia jejuensis TaxID=648894 RepID=A0ABW0PF75_9BURK